ncbi:hypothetical protein D3C84_521600 [compost metagenome]
MPVVAQSLRVGGAEGHRFQAQSVKAVDQAHVAGECHPFQPAHGQQIGNGNDAHPRIAGVGGGQIADLDNAGRVHRTLHHGADQCLDRFVQITLQKQRLVTAQAYPGDRAQFAVAAAYAEQLRHELTNVCTVNLAKALLDKVLEYRPLFIARQGAGQDDLWRFCLAEVQRQCNVPVEIGHGRNASLYKFEGSIRGIS